MQLAVISYQKKRVIVYRAFYCSTFQHEFLNTVNCPLKTIFMKLSVAFKSAHCQQFFSFSAH